ncbi:MULTISPECIES: glycosyltransferase family 2 protein [Vibrio]|uniref:glycosyltransferase family 2 protein n=1 Tax=Vibrio TaxID=662 RepID=UPI00107F5345|nr:glycosyltransferase family 2 protein [Vibrio tasmaniensis]
MTIYISVVSHGHSDLINELGCVNSLCSGEFQIVVKSNKLGDDFNSLQRYKNFHWLNDDNDYGCGFGGNNNIIFNYCRELGMEAYDYFIVLNPDVSISKKMLYSLIDNMNENKARLSAINLHKDVNANISDNSIRNFPRLTDFFLSFFGGKNKTIVDKKNITLPTKVDWAAGSFLAFKSEHYKTLGGFDERYFMYCEDIDICYRSYLINERVLYFPFIKAVHLAKHANRDYLSKHFYWHVMSAVRFLLKKRGMLIGSENILK